MGDHRRILLLTVMALLFCLAGCTSTAGTPAGTVPSTTAVPETTLPPTTAAPPEMPEYVEVFREGEVSRIPVVTVDGTVGNYRIAMDPEYFTFLPGETADLFSCEVWDGEVFFAISAYNSADAQKFVTDTVTHLGHMYQAVNIGDTTIGTYPATGVYLERSRENPEFNRHVFLIDCGDARYILEAQFTTEMYEGLYAIMRALFDTFRAY